MNVFSGSKMWAEAAEHMGMTIPAVQKAVSEGKANQTRGTPDKSLSKSQDTKGGWGKKFGTAQEALNDAIQSVDTKLWNSFNKEFDSNTTNHPITNAINAVMQDVRQDKITPMQGAMLLSQTYEDGGVDALSKLYNHKTGNLHDNVLDEAKQIGEGKASKEISDLFTLTDEYKWGVTTQDKKTFARSLANKISGMNDGDIKTIHIYCKDKVYTFMATGYMKGHIVLSENTNVIELRKNFFEEYYEENVNANRTIVGLWAEPVPNQQGRQVDDVGIPSRRGGPIVDDLLSKNPPPSNRERNNERVWENTYSEEEVKQIVQQLKKLYSIETTGKASRELGTAHLDAVKSGDTETAQKMVDEAA